MQQTVCVYFTIIIIDGHSEGRTEGLWLPHHSPPLQDQGVIHIHVPSVVSDRIENKDLCVLNNVVIEGVKGETGGGVRRIT